MAGIAFGLFDWVDRQEVPLGRLYAERLEVVQAADAAGFSTEVDDVICCFAWGDLSLAHSLRLFTDEVLPVFAR